MIEEKAVLRNDKILRTSGDARASKEGMVIWIRIHDGKLEKEFTQTIKPRHLDGFYFFTCPHEIEPIIAKDENDYLEITYKNKEK